MCQQRLSTALSLNQQSDAPVPFFQAYSKSYQNNDHAFYNYGDTCGEEQMEDHKISAASPYEGSSLESKFIEILPEAIHMNNIEKH